MQGCPASPKRSSHVRKQPHFWQCAHPAPAAPRAPPPKARNHPAPSPLPRPVIFASIWLAYGLFAAFPNVWFLMVRPRHLTQQRRRRRVTLRQLRQAAASHAGALRPWCAVTRARTPPHPSSFNQASIVVLTVIMYSLTIIGLVRGAALSAEAIQRGSVGSVGSAGSAAACGSAGAGGNQPAQRAAAQRFVKPPRRPSRRDADATCPIPPLPSPPQPCGLLGAFVTLYVSGGAARAACNAPPCRKAESATSQVLVRVALTCPPASSRVLTITPAHLLASRPQGAGTCTFLMQPKMAFLVAEALCIAAVLAALLSVFMFSIVFPEYCTDLVRHCGHTAHWMQQPRSLVCSQQSHSCRNMYSTRAAAAGWLQQGALVPAAEPDRLLLTAPASPLPALPGVGQPPRGHGAPAAHGTPCGGIKGGGTALGATLGPRRLLVTCAALPAAPACSIAPHSAPMVLTCHRAHKTNPSPVTHLLRSRRAWCAAPPCRRRRAWAPKSLSAPRCAL